MAVGDLVRQRDLTWDLEVIRIPGRFDPSEGGDLVNGKLFQARLPPKPPSRLTRIWRSLPFARRTGASAPAVTKALSLLQLLDQRHDVVTYGTPSAGRETVAVPFTHVALLTSPGGRHGGKLSADHVHEIEQAFKDRFDQNVDARSVRIGAAATPMLESGSILAFFGRGVFIPKEGERPVGRIRIGPSLDTLVEPSLLGGGLAGLYRGQAALAFGSSHSVVPATARLGLEDEAWFYLEGSLRPTEALALTAHELPATYPERQPTEADALWRIDVAYDDPDERFAKTLFVEVTVDERPSRFHSTLPARGPVFEIAGLRLRDDDLPGGTETFWIDLDADARPPASAITPRVASIVHDGRRVRRYSWRQFEYDSSAAGGFDITRDGAGWTFRPSNGEPLGYLVSPPNPMPAIFQADWWTSRGYHLDWLDFSGCVENDSGIRGLAEAHAHRDTVLMPSFATAPQGEFEVGPLILRRARGEGA